VKDISLRSNFFSNWI